MRAEERKKKPMSVLIFKNKTVFEESLDRIRWIFDEFPNVVVNYSGGKDSTVIFHLALQVAREKGRLPLKVLFIDQEAEWEGTVEMVRKTMYHPDVDPMWFQVPIKLLNATSATDQWLHCWEAGKEDEWIHPQDPISIKENVYGTDRFVKLFDAILTQHFKGKTAFLTGVRAEESPSRLLGLTHFPAYKWATWGRKVDKQAHKYHMHPIYDWSFSDVWKAIHDNNWPYNRIYDLQYRYGVSRSYMRVSNIHHETAVSALFYLQEIEPQTYVKLVKRIHGIDMAGKMGSDDYFIKNHLPYMFASWREYRDYLLENLIPDKEIQERFRKEYAKHELLVPELGDLVYRTHIQSILANDIEMTKMNNFRSSPKAMGARRRMKEAALRDQEEMAV